MAQEQYDRSYQAGPPPLTQVVKYIIIACVVCYFVEFTVTKLAIPLFGPYSWNDIFGLVPETIRYRYWVWQFFTYIFQHGPPFHLLFNMLILWFFGAELELRMGKQGFLTYFLVCGIGAGVFNFIISQFFGDPSIPIIGASGAIYGLLVAYGMFFANRYFLVFFLFPMKAKYFVMLMAGFELVFGVKGSPADNVAHFAHLGGMLVGAIYLWLKYKGPFNGGSSKRDLEREKLRKQFTLIVNQGPPNGQKPKDPYWN